MNFFEPLDDHSLEYAISEVSDDNLYDKNTGENVYQLEVYYKGMIYSAPEFYLYDKDTYVDIPEWKSVPVTIGESATLEIEAFDYMGEQIELSEEWSYSWIKYGVENTSGEEEIGTDSTYVFDSVSEEDMQYEYKCVINDGEYVIRFILETDEEETTPGKGEGTNPEITIEGGALTLNEGINASAEGGSIIYSFTAPESGNYYFFSAGKDDMCAELTGEGVLTSDDDSGYNRNFMILCYLDEGETYELKVSELDYENFDSTIFVCDETAADAHYGGCKEDKVYVTKGEAFTIEPSFVSITEKPYVLPDGYTFKWTKQTMDYDTYESTETDLKTNTLNYTIDEVTDDDLFIESEKDATYCLTVYNGDEIFTSVNYRLYDKETYMAVEENNEVYAVVGESVTLELIAKDYFGNPIEVNEEDHTFEWHKYNREDGTYELVGTDSSYVIDSVTEADFNSTYECYIDGYQQSAFYHIYNRITSFEDLYENRNVTVGESVTLEAVAKYMTGETVDLTGEEFKFEWYRVTNQEYANGAFDEVIGMERTYTIAQVDDSDIFAKSNIMYVCVIHNIETGAYTKYPIFLVDSAAEQETPTDEVETTTGVEETTTSGEGETTTTGEGETTTGIEETTTAKVEATTPAPTTAAPTTKAADITTVVQTPATQKVKAPAKAKIKKVTPKKKASKVVKLQINKVKGAKGYQVQIAKAKKFTKKNILVDKNVKKLKPSIKSKKIKNKKKLFVRARAYVLDANGKKVYGKWSKAKKVKIK